MLGVALVLSLPALARRTAPLEVAPVVIEGVRYEVPHFNNPCAQNGGCVVARDVATGAQLWWAKVYTTAYDPFLERDVQDVFITSLSEQLGNLQGTDEKGRPFSVDVGSKAARGPGCTTIAASPATGWWALAALMLARRRVAARTR